MTDNPSPSDIRQEDVRELSDWIIGYLGNECGLIVGEISKADRLNVENAIANFRAALSAQTGEPVACQARDETRGGIWCDVPIERFNANPDFEYRWLYASPSPQPDTAPSPLSTGEELAFIHKTLEDIADGYSKHYQGKFPRDNAWYALERLERLQAALALSQPPATEQIRREVIEPDFDGWPIEALEEVERLRTQVETLKKALHYIAAVDWRWKGGGSDVRLRGNYSKVAAHALGLPANLSPGWPSAKATEGPPTDHSAEQGGHWSDHPVQGAPTASRSEDG